MIPPFAERLNRLFDTIYPPGRGPYKASEVREVLSTWGIELSAPYLSQLRTGNRANPSGKTIEALAAFFGVDADYFTDDASYEELDEELTWLHYARDSRVRSIVTRIIGLPPAAQDEILRKADQLSGRTDLAERQR